MFLNFEKWHGCQNDFIVAWVLVGDDTTLNSVKRQGKALCSRGGTSIGADGVILLHAATSRELLPTSITIINSDGSLAEVCGNGIRCVALSVLRRFRTEGKLKELPDSIEFKSGSRTISCRFLGHSKISERDMTWPYVAVNMGATKVNQETAFYNQAQTAIQRVAKELKLPQLTQDFGVCDIGNKHIVFFLDEISREILHRVGPAFQKCPEWDGINVHLVCPEDMPEKEKSGMANLLGHKPGDGYRALVWERGAGPTAACGSGACAIAACAMEAGSASRKDWLAIHMPGGYLFAKQDSAEDAMTQIGRAHV